MTETILIIGSSIKKKIVFLSTIELRSNIKIYIIKRQSDRQRIKEINKQYKEVFKRRARRFVPISGIFILF